MAKNVNRTARLQWKVDTIKNCIYLQCISVLKVSSIFNFFIDKIALANILMSFSCSNLALDEIEDL